MWTAMGMMKKNLIMKMEGGDFAEEEEADHWPNSDGCGRRETGQLPEEATLDQRADGDEELVAEVELPVAVQEAAEAEDVGLHGGDYDDFVWAVGGFVGEEEESVAEGGDEGEDGGDSQGQGWFHVRSVGTDSGHGGFLRSMWMSLVGTHSSRSGMTNKEQARTTQADPPPAAKDDN
jgi:hypothetical protein